MSIHSVAAPITLALALGARHGLDADHLAAIDALTRWNSHKRPVVAAVCGALFSAGHLAVIIGAAGLLAMLSRQYVPPAWLEPVGTIVSGTTLLLLALMNLRAALSGAPGAGPVGLRTGWMRRLFRVSGWWRIALVGALFAVSFDALAIAGLLASSREGVGGLVGSATGFAAGMLLVGSANGLWLVRLLRHPDRRASQVMTWTISLITFAVSLRVLMPLVSAPVHRWVQDYELAVSTGIMMLMIVGYALSLRASRRPTDVPARRTAASLLPS